MTYSQFEEAVSIQLEATEFHDISFLYCRFSKGLGMPAFSSVSVVADGVASWPGGHHFGAERSTGVPGNLNCSGRFPRKGLEEKVVVKRPDLLLGMDNFVSLAFKAYALNHLRFFLLRYIERATA